MAERPKVSSARLAASILVFLFAARFTILFIGTVIIILLRVSKPDDPSRFNPTALKATMIIAWGIAAMYAALAVVHIVGGIKLLGFSRAWTRYLIVLAFLDIGLAVVLNQATVYLVTTVCSRLTGLTYEQFQRVVNAELAFMVTPGCAGAVCSGIFALGLSITLIVLLFKLRGSPAMP